MADPKWRSELLSKRADKKKADDVAEALLAVDKFKHLPAWQGTLLRKKEEEKIQRDIKILEEQRVIN